MPEVVWNDEIERAAIDRWRKRIGFGYRSQKGSEIPYGNSTIREFRTILMMRSDAVVVEAISDSNLRELVTCELWKQDIPFIWGFDGPYGVELVVPRGEELRAAITISKQARYLGQIAEGYN